MKPYQFQDRIIGSEHGETDGPETPDGGPLIMTVSGP